MPDEIMDKLLDFKKPAYNTDNKGKLFVTVFAFLPAGRQVLLLPRQIRNVYTATAPVPIYNILHRD
ncbi:MAG: hypothetical protein MUO72_17170 [Bacteroidales bacterium]|nr:hypothetical protein [Bacteroidales bacterium]